MTKNKARKTAARAEKANTGKPYTLALREVAIETPLKDYLCADLTHALAREFTNCGWMTGPVGDAGDYKDPFMAEYALDIGPARLTITRADHEGYISNLDYDPDDPEFADLSTPPVLSLYAPTFDFEGNTDDEGYLEAYPDLTDDTYANPASLASAIREQITTSRKKGLTSRHIRARCNRCRQPYAEHHLIYFTETTFLCPFCLFDTDDSYLRLAGFIRFYDKVSGANTDYPVAWTAIATLIACMINNSDRTYESLADERDFPIILDHWEDPSRFWLWLPQGPDTPDHLRQFGAGATLGAIITATDAAYPNLKQTYLHTVLAEYGYTPEDLEQLPHDETDLDIDDDLYAAHIAQSTLDAMWPAVIAFSIAYLMTPHTEGTPTAPSNWAAMFDHEGWYSITEDNGIYNPADIMSNCWQVVRTTAPALADQLTKRWGL